MKETRRTTPPKEAFQWDELSLPPLVEALRNLARARLDHLLELGPAPGVDLYLPLVPDPKRIKRVFPGIDHPVFEQGERPGLLTRLGNAGVALIRERPTLAWHRFRLNRRRNPAEQEVHWRPLLRHTLKSRLSSAARGRLMTLLFAHRFFGTRPFHLPAHLWRTVGKLAFSQPDFALEVAQKINGFLRSRVMLDPSNLPPIVVSANTFWLLIALYQPKRPSLAERLRPARRKSEQVRKALRREGQRQARTSAWAGFWDQWLLLHSLIKAPGDLGRLDPDFRRALPALPLPASTSLSWPKVDEDAHVPSLALAADSCKQQGPGRLFQLYESTLWEVASGV